jgi:iron complex transport system ATP-binding protein
MLLLLHQAKLRLGRRELGPFSLRLAAGESVAILGPSGAGKSSLLKLIAREQPCCAGRITINGRALPDWPAAALARRRAVLPQSHALAVGLPVEQVVSLGRAARDADGRPGAIVREALACTQALHLLDRRFDTLSGSERARVLLARVFAQLWDERDGLLLVDELLTALDPGLALELTRAMQGFAAARGHALVVVVHDLSLALNHFQRLWLLQEGRVLADCDAVPAVLPLLEQLYDVRLRLLRDTGGLAVLAGAPSTSLAGATGLVPAALCTP